MKQSTEVSLILMLIELSSIGVRTPERKVLFIHGQGQVRGKYGGITPFCEFPLSFDDFHWTFVTQRSGWLDSKACTQKNVKRIVTRPSTSVQPTVQNNHYH